MAANLKDRPLSIWIGYDPREASCFAVARSSAKRRLTTPVKINGLVLDRLQARKLYARPMEWRTRSRFGDWQHIQTQLWDVVSDAPMSTEFACSRFLVPHLAGKGLALFVDCDVLFRVNPMEVFAAHEDGAAVSVVKHDFRPTNKTKMDGQQQTSYSRKCWSSVMVFDCDHPANKKLTLDMVNTRRGLDLHNFCWLEDQEIGSLPDRFNYLVGHSVLPPEEEPAIVHWTSGAPCIDGYQNAEYANEFWGELTSWAA